MIITCRTSCEILCDGKKLCVISHNRKNWLFSYSPKGAQSIAGVYTLIEIAKANGLNPNKYIQYILSDIPGTGFLEHPEFLEDYMPWDPYIQKICR